MLALGDVYLDPKKLYIAFKSFSNICDVVIQNSRLKVFINMKKGSLVDPNGLAYDISEKGHHGNGDYEVHIRSKEDIDLAMPLIQQAYEVNKKENSQ